MTGVLLTAYSQMPPDFTCVYCWSTTPKGRRVSSHLNIYPDYLEKSLNTFIFLTFSFNRPRPPSMSMILADGPWRDAPPPLLPRPAWSCKVPCESTDVVCMQSQGPWSATPARPAGALHRCVELCGSPAAVSSSVKAGTHF